MKIWNAVRSGVKAFTQMLFQPMGYGFIRLPRSRFDFQKQVGDGMGSSAIMAPLLWIARTFPEAPPALWQDTPDGQEEPVTDHPLLRLLERPNPFYSGAVMWMATLVDWNVNGDAMWLKVRNKAGAVQQLWYTPSWLLEPEGTETEYITRYKYTANPASPTYIDPKDVVHFRYGLDPENIRRGLSPLKSVLREVFTDDEAANFTASLLRNMGVPGVVVSPDSDDYEPDEDEVEATKEYIKANFTGDHRGEPLVMKGRTKVEQFGFSPTQMSLKDLRRIPEERTTAVIGVPAIVAGLGAGLDRSTFANYAEAREAAYEQNVIPSQRIIAEDVRFQLLTDFEQDPWAWRFGFDLSQVRVLQEDRNKEAERWAKLVVAGIATRKEARRPFGLEVDDVADDIFLIPIASVETPRKNLPEPIVTNGGGNPDNVPPVPVVA